jgi:hypothetical protein
MRRGLVVVVAAFAVAACSRLPPEAPAGEPSIDGRAIDVYAAVITYMAGTEPSGGRVYVQNRPCDSERVPIEDHEGEFTWELRDKCGSPFSEEEQQALRDLLGELRDVEFVSDWKAVQDRIFEATGAGTGSDLLIRFARAPAEGDRLEIPASAYCGGLCAHWMTLVVEQVAGAWKVTGTTGPVGIA